MGNAILSRDFPLVQGGLISIAASLLFLNIVVDVLYFWLDPRIRVKSRD
jgi:peptide/nickel transport system permease protein